MAAHAQIIPSIATGIARLRNAQSPTLREKLTMVTSQGPQINNGKKQLDAEDEIKKRLWLLCRTRIQPEPIKGPQNQQKGDHNTSKGPSSQVHHSRPEPPDLQICEPNSNNVLGDMEYHGLNAGYDGYELFEEEVYDDDFPEAYVEELGEADYVEPPSDDWTNSSEGDYFYTDGHGNIYPVESHDALQADEVHWPPIEQLVELEESGNEEVEDVVLYADENPNQTYIMYDEAQHCPIPPGASIHPQTW